MEGSGEFDLIFGIPGQGFLLPLISEYIFKPL